MTSSPASSFLELAVGTTAFARFPLPTMALNPNPLAPRLRAACSPAAATSISDTPGATAAFMAS